MTVYVVLRTVVILTAVRALFRRDYESLMLCVLTLVLLILPSILEKRLRIELPNILETIILFFIYAAEILGEINNFYVIVPHWDTMLHTFNGFACAAIFSVIGYFYVKQRGQGRFAASFIPRVLMRDEPESNFRARRVHDDGIQKINKRRQRT